MEEGCREICCYGERGEVEGVLMEEGWNGIYSD